MRMTGKNTILIPLNSIALTVALVLFYIYCYKESIDCLSIYMLVTSNEDADV